MKLLVYPTLVAALAMPAALPAQAARPPDLQSFLELSDDQVDQLRQLLEELSLFRGKLVGRPDQDPEQLVPSGRAVQVREPQSLQPEDLPALNGRGNLHARHAVDGGNLHLVSQSRLGEGHR